MNLFVLAESKAKIIVFGNESLLMNCIYRMSDENGLCVGGVGNSSCEPL